MPQPTTSPLYDRIGTDYSINRSTDPRLERQLHDKLTGASRIINIGAGTGSYEPTRADLLAIEPSMEMIAQRPESAHPVQQASAEALPVADNSFSHAMTVLSMHHWRDRKMAFQEITRVATERFVAITWDPAAPPFWLTRDYFPEIFEEDLRIFPALDELEDNFDNVEVTPLLIPHDCIDGFLAAFWKRPAAYLDYRIRQSISTFAKLENIDDGLERLKADLDSGSWVARNADLLSKQELDAGYRLITADIRND